MRKNQKRGNNQRKLKRGRKITISSLFAKVIINTGMSYAEVKSLPIPTFWLIVDEIIYTEVQKENMMKGMFG